MLVRFYAVGREVAGCSEAQFDVTSYGELTHALERRFGTRMGRLVDASTLLLDGVRHRSTDAVELTESDIVDLLPPFAGG